MTLANPRQRGWRLAFALGPFNVWFVRQEKYGWSRFVIRYRDCDAPRRSYQLSWNGERFAGGIWSDHLAADHPGFYKQLAIRLRDWRPPQ